MKHTGGPWTIAGTHGTIIEAQEKTIASMIYTNLPKAQANARLIAQAPAMADLLRRILAQYFDPTWPHMHFGFPEEIRKQLREIDQVQP